MTTFATSFALGASPLLLTQFGEAATYTPSGGAGVACTVLVERNDYLDGGRAVHEILAWLPKSVATSVRVGADTLAVKHRISDAAAKTFVITEMLADGQAGGLWHVRLL